MDGGESRGPHCLAIGLLLDGRKDALSCQSDRWSSAADPMHDLLNIYIVAIASGHQPPSVSTTMGRKSTPAARQDGRLDVSFLRTPTLRAWPREEAASNRVSCCSGDITLTPSAAGRPRHQFGRRMSAGRVLKPGTKLGDSFVGARAADWAALNSTSRIALWRAIRSPLPPQPTW